jgi:glutamate decarboxylase
MAIYSKGEILPNLDDQIFGTSFLPHSVPKYKFPKQETDPNAAYQLVHDELLLDGIQMCPSSGRIKSFRVHPWTQRAR